MQIIHQKSNSVTKREGYNPKYFGEDDEANIQYDKALSFDMDESQKNLINLKRPIK